jgi:hypothetical protein
MSTHHKPVEVMGVTLPTLFTSSSEDSCDSMSLGDKDSICHHDLLSLEGKPSPDGFSLVVQDLRTPYGHFHSSYPVFSDPTAL